MASRHERAERREWAGCRELAEWRELAERREPVEPREAEWEKAAAEITLASLASAAISRKTLLSGTIKAVTRLKTLPTRRRAPYLRLMLLVIAGVIGFDQASKIAIEAALQPGQAFPILGDWFRFLLVYNPGAAFSLGSESSTWLFTTFQLVFLVGVLLASPRIDDRFQAIALAMVAGGAGGNLVDRLFREPGFWFGHVVDFISVGDFAIFNVADSFITVGVVLFLAAVFTEEHRARKAVTDTPQNSIEQPVRPTKEVDDEH